MPGSDNTLSLFVIDKENTEDAAIRIYDSSDKQVFYASTRIGTVRRYDNGYAVEKVDDYVDMNYELKKIGSGKIINGIITQMQNSSNEE